VLDTESFRIPQRFVGPEHLAGEAARLREALKQAAAEAPPTRPAISDKPRPQYGAIFEAHVHLIEDPALAGEIESLISSKVLPPSMPSAGLCASTPRPWRASTAAILPRAPSISSIIEKIILRNLLGSAASNCSILQEPVIVLAHDLTPSETAILDPQRVLPLPPKRADVPATRRSWPAPWRSPPWSAWRAFVTDISGETS